MSVVITNGGKTVHLKRKTNTDHIFPSSESAIFDPCQIVQIPLKEILARGSFNDINFRSKAEPVLDILKIKKP